MLVCYTVLRVAGIQYVLVEMILGMILSPEIYYRKFWSGHQPFLLSVGEFVRS